MQPGFQEKLTRIQAYEVQRGQTTIGPHRDEVRFLANSVDLGTYGSRGQVRTAMMTLKLAEVGWMKQKTGEYPVLLLDEVLAELDEDRRQDLLRHVHNGQQALLTTTDLTMFDPQFVKQARIWQIKAGKLKV